jgi:hypothetical protein
MRHPVVAGGSILRFLHGWICALEGGSVNDDYRWIVVVTPHDQLLGRVRMPYSREVSTEGPQPEEAVRRALDLIGDINNDL